MAYRADIVLGLNSGQTRSAASSTASTASEMVRALRRRRLLRWAASASESTRQSESKLELRIGVFLLFAALGRGGGAVRRGLIIDCGEEMPIARSCKG